MVYTDIMLYFYATGPASSEDDEEEAALEQTDEPGEVVSTLVWICAQKDQIPPEAEDVAGTMCSLDASGEKVVVALPKSSVGLTVLSAEAVEKSTHAMSSSSVAFALSSLTLD